MRRAGLRWLVLLVITLMTLAASGASPAVAAPADDPRAFAETGYRVADDAFWAYFTGRGGVRTFGYPVSRAFTLQDFTVQIFQRGVLQEQPDGSVQPLDLLDGLMPYTRVNGSTYPDSAGDLAMAAPQVDDPDYDRRIVEFVHAAAPDTWQGLPVRFGSTFFGTVTCADAFPHAPCQESMLPLMDLELWGVPTSAPQYDPHNHDVVYQRFQRGILQYDATCQCTQGILLGDLFKALLTGQGLAADLAAEAQGSPYLRQYDPTKPHALAHPERLSDTDLADAFSPDVPSG
jgi:hypothetical protein